MLEGVRLQTYIIYPAGPPTPTPTLPRVRDVIMNLSLEKQTQTVQKVASTTAESKHGL